MGKLWGVLLLMGVSTAVQAIPPTGHPTYFGNTKNYYPQTSRVYPNIHYRYPYPSAPGYLVYNVYRNAYYYQYNGNVAPNFRYNTYMPGYYRPFRYPSYSPGTIFYP